MKNIITSYGIEGHPWNIYDYEHMQQGFKEALNAIVLSITTNPNDILLLYGCSISRSSTNTFTTAGWIFYNGEVIQVDPHNIPGIAGTLYWYVDRTVFDPQYVTYFNSTQRQVHSIPKLRLRYGTGDFLNSSLVIYDLKNSFVSKDNIGVPDSNGFYNPNLFTNPGFYKIDYSQINNLSVSNPYNASWYTGKTVVNPGGETLFEYYYKNNAVSPFDIHNNVDKYIGNIKVTKTPITKNNRFNYPPNFITDTIIEQEMSIFSVIWSTTSYTTNAFPLETNTGHNTNGTDISMYNSDTNYVDPPYNASNSLLFVPMTFKRYYTPYSIADDNENYFMSWTDWKKIY